MKILRSIKNAPAHLAAVAASAAMSSPAFADGFAKAETLLEKISSGLTGLAIVTITIA
nr:TrbC/VirB2 family protein [Escherichia coli]